MKRIPEPELMTDVQQVQAYATADFEEPHALFIRLFSAYFPQATLRDAQVLDLGCGPADITRRFAQAFEYCHLDAVDGSAAMLKQGENTLKRYGLTERVRFLTARLPEGYLSPGHYHAIISNSLLHHLADPQVLWETIKSTACPDALIFVMDLIRPESIKQVEIMVDRYAGGESNILRRDFFNSLLAAYRIDEVHAQLQHADLGYLHVHEVSDRHLVVVGTFKGPSV
jgi:2-polyprenyl-3-methyl-5-hydroxy-6-metoxy-1,4-benzoquinol methylase